MRFPALIGAIALAGCHGGKAANEAQTTAGLPAETLPSSAPDGGFAPLQSAAVKDAIHRALVTGTDQRWQDGAWSGYAVPSRATLANGCRTIRYTIDQQPDAPATTINACDADKP